MKQKRGQLVKADAPRMKGKKMSMELELMTVKRSGRHVSTTLHTDHATAERLLRELCEQPRNRIEELTAGWSFHRDAECYAACDRVEDAAHYRQKYTCDGCGTAEAAA